MRGLGLLDLVLDFFVLRFLAGEGELWLSSSDATRADKQREAIVEMQA